MSDVNISTNMSMPVPIASQTDGPDWAQDVVSCFDIIDQHSHSSGKGVPITPDAININSDLTFAGFNAINLKSVRFSPQGVALAGASDLGCLFEVGVDLYYRDGVGNTVRITQGGAVSGATGTITGLPSGTASASFSGATFTFQSATSTPAAINAGSYKIGRQDTSGFGVTLQASGSLPANYSLTMPLALPAAQSAVVSDASGNLSFLSLAYLSGTFIATFTQAGGYSVPVTITYTKINAQVVLNIPGFSALATANASIDSGATDLPSFLRPTTTLVWAPTFVTEAGGIQTVPGVLEFNSTGSIRLFRTATPGGTTFSSGGLAGTVPGVQSTATYNA